MRRYPVQFGLAVADILPELKATARGCPPAPKEEVRALDMLLSEADREEESNEDLFEGAYLSDVYEYLRRGKHLNMPPEWKAHLPVPVLSDDL